MTTNTQLLNAKLSDILTRAFNSDARVRIDGHDNFKIYGKGNHTEDGRSMFHLGFPVDNQLEDGDMLIEVSNITLNSLIGILSSYSDDPDIYVFGTNEWLISYDLYFFNIIPNGPIHTDKPTTVAINHLENPTVNDLINALRGAHPMSRVCINGQNRVVVRIDRDDSYGQVHMSNENLDPVETEKTSSDQMSFFDSGLPKFQVADCSKCVVRRSCKNEEPTCTSCCITKDNQTNIVDLTPSMIEHTDCADCEFPSKCILNRDNCKLSVCCKLNNEDPDMCGCNCHYQLDCEENDGSRCPSKGCCKYNKE